MNGGAQWCPEQQIYVGGIATSSTADSHISQVLENDLPLYIFGYGSLCWHPGEGVLSHPSVQTELGVTKGFRRCWSQKSTDHRGETSFPGIVCTLLSDEEYRSIAEDHGGNVCASEQSTTNGLVYMIPKELVKQCLEELDFREKGGYARDVIDVTLSDYSGEDGETKTIQAMLYRGTPDNPAFSNRALFDELHTASIISAARGPSGKNDVYLYQLSDYLSQCVDVSDRSLVGDSHTTRLTALSKLMQEHRLYFLYGSGSNQHDQLLLKSSKNQMNSAKLVNDDEAHDLKEFVLVVPKGPKGEDDYEDDSIHRPKRLFAGGGHSGLLTHNGNFYLWGWNDDRQLGRDRHEGLNDGVDIQSHPIVPPLDIKVETAALGHSHTLIIEKGTKSLYAFGDDNRGQVGGGEQANSGKLTRLDFGKFVEVSAGLFHSAGVTENGELVTFGCGRFGQSLCISADSNVGKWSPPDGSRLVKVVCGRRHTVCVDEHGRVWSMGDNKYGQLGRQVENERDQKMELVDGILGQKGSGCVDIDCGWSHTIAMVETDEKRVGYTLYGWGRNDKSQIAFNGKQEPIINSPRPVGHCLNFGLKGACCGSESISILDVQNNLMSCGWNEHGNLGIGHSADVSEFTKIVGANILSPYNDGSNMENDEILIASGGAHFLATKVVF